MGVNMIHATTLRPRFVTTHVRLNKHVASTLPNLHLRFSFLRISTCPNSHRTRGSDTLLHIRYHLHARAHAYATCTLANRTPTHIVRDVNTVSSHLHNSLFGLCWNVPSTHFTIRICSVCFTYAFSAFTSLHLSPEFRILLTHTSYHS